jgi:hypothetical protein
MTVEEERAEKTKKILLKVLEVIRLILYVAIGCLNIAAFISQNAYVCTSAVITLFLLIGVLIFSIRLERK